MKIVENTDKRAKRTYYRHLMWLSPMNVCFTSLNVQEHAFKMLQSFRLAVKQEFKNYNTLKRLADTL